MDFPFWKSRDGREEQDERGFRALVEHSPDIICRLARDFRYIYVSPSMSTYRGIPAADFIATFPGELNRQPPELIEKTRRKFDEAIETKAQTVTEVSHLSPRGTTVSELRFIPELDAKGDVSTVMLIIRDMSDLRESERKLAEVNAELERRVRSRTEELDRINGTLAEEIRERRDMEKWLVAARQAALEGAKLKTSFVANISHEIRTPIHAITGMLYALSETALTDQQRKYVATIQKAADALMILLNDVLDFSKMESGKLNLYFKEFDLRELIDQSTETFARDATKRGLRWSIHMDPALPSHLRSDAPRIRQVLTNFLSNASKFTSAGEISVNVKAEKSSGSRTWVRFEVKDTGIGIPESARSVVFEEFSQVDGSSSRKHGGAGLGLSICKKLVELLEGSIGFESEQGKGSTFWFVIPVDIVTVPLEAVAPKKPIGPQKKGRILLVEDNPVNQEVTATLLQSFGHDVKIADNGKLAIELSRNEVFDLIIMDCQMPEMDGYQTTRVIRDSERSAERRIPIVAMTADAMKDAASRCLAAGMNDYLSKPVHVESLREKLQVWLMPHEGTTERSHVRIDESAVENLKSFKTVGAPNLFIRLVEIYLDDAPPRVARMIDAVEKSDAKALEADAHYLKSASATIGAQRLSQICQEIEDLGRTYDPIRARRLLGEFHDEYRFAVEELKLRAGK